jgi:ABC-type Mn2+/Zn2+ transport system permease subunit
MFQILIGLVIISAVIGTSLTGFLLAKASIYQTIGYLDEIRELKNDTMPSLFFCYGFSVGVIAFVFLWLL